RHSLLHFLAFNGVTSSHPTIHTVRQIIYLFEARDHSDLSSSGTPLSHGAHKDDIFVFRQVQFFECLAERVNPSEGNQFSFGNMAAIPFVWLTYINDMCPCFDHAFGIIGTNGGIWK